jgi:hypothetical protein
MKKIKLPKLFGVSFLSILVLVGGLFFGQSIYNNQQQNQTSQLNISASYSSEVKDPMWNYNNADFVIIGEIVGKEDPKKGKENATGHDVIYQDTKVKITQVVKNTLSDENLKENKVIYVRTLGGTADGLSVNTDTKNIFRSSGNVLLCLVEGTKIPNLPESSKDNKVYAITGTIHGAFNLTSDGLAQRDIVGDSFDKNKLIKMFSNQIYSHS